MAEGVGGRRLRVAVEGLVALAAALLLFRWARNAPRKGPPFSRDAAYQVRLLIPVVILALIGAPLLAMVAVRSPLSTGQDRRPAQPMWFDHRHHAADFRIPCTYCHAGADRGAMAELPATEVCVPCHNQQWLASSAFAPVRQSLATGRPIPWRRVNVLPDFVFFDHAVHVKRGVGCADCHGRVERMALVRQEQPLTMSWCLQCHRQRAGRTGPLAECTACHR